MALSKSWLRPVNRKKAGFFPVDSVAATRPLIYLRPQDIPSGGWTTSPGAWVNRGTDTSVPEVDVIGTLTTSIPLPGYPGLNGVRFTSTGNRLSVGSSWTPPTNMLFAMWMRFIFPTTRDYDAGATQGAGNQARTGVTTAAFPVMDTNGGVPYTWADFISASSLTPHFLKFSTTEGQWWENGVEHTPRPAGDYSVSGNGFLLQPNDLADFGALAVWDGDQVDETTVRTAFETLY